MHCEAGSQLDTNLDLQSELSSNLQSMSSVCDSFTIFPSSKAARELPQELVDIVIDQLHDNPAALRRCSLVCKAWEPSTTLHLFSCWSWPPCGHVWEAYTTPSSSEACVCGDRKNTSLARCFEILSSSPRICRGIRRLRIWSHQPQPGSSFPPNSFIQLSGILNILPSLHSLHCTDCQMVPWEQYDGSATDFGRKSLATVHNDGSHPASLHTAALLTLFDDIDYLIVSGFADRSLTVPLLNPPQDLHRTRVRTLKIDNSRRLSDVSGVFRIIQDHVDLQVLERLELMYCRLPQDASFFQSATRLSAVTYCVHSTHCAHIPPNLPLESLSMTGSLWLSHEGSSHDGWQHILRDVAGLLYHHLEQLSIVLQFFDPRYWPSSTPPPPDQPFSMLEEFFHASDWTPLSTLPSRCPSLRNVHITLRVPRDGYFSSFFARNVSRTRAVILDAAAQRSGRGLREMLEVEVDVVLL